MHRAAEEGDAREIERLLMSGYDVNLFDDMGYAPIHRAVVSGQTKAVKLLLLHGALVNANDDATIGETPLALAVQTEDLRLVHLLLESGANPDITGWMGLTARDRARSRVDAAGQEVNALLANYSPRS